MALWKILVLDYNGLPRYGDAAIETHIVDVTAA